LIKRVKKFVDCFLADRYHTILRYVKGPWQ
jgi:hypothetical protein